MLDVYALNICQTKVIIGPHNKKSYNFFVYFFGHDAHNSCRLQLGELVFQELKKELLLSKFRTVTL